VQICADVHFFVLIRTGVSDSVCLILVSGVRRHRTARGRTPEDIYSCDPRARMYERPETTDRQTVISNLLRTA
jgi:hypothetical protein